MDIEKPKKSLLTVILNSKSSFDCFLLCFVRNFLTFIKILFLTFLIFNLSYFSNQYYKLLLRVKDLEDFSKPLTCPKRTTNPAPTKDETIIPEVERKFYPFLISEDKKCKNDEGDFLPVFLLLAIKSRTVQFRQRNAVRRTWGDEALIPGVTIKRIFLLASNNNEGIQELLHIEAAEHRDIVQAGFFDSFRNLTLKEVMFLRWVHLYCPRAKFIFKGDDDVLANIFNIVEYLQSLSPKQSRTLFAGSVLYPSPRISNPQSKYYVPKHLYHHQYYPPYVSGGGFLMSSLVGRRVFRIMKTVPLIPIDDAFMGICLKAVRLKPQNHNGFKTWGAKYMKRSIVNLNCTLQEVMVWHRFSSDALLLTWKNLLASQPFFHELCSNIFTVKINESL